MPRVAPKDRLARLAEAATQQLIAHGFTRMQMADVAERLGVAKGTVYLSVASKEALFDLCVRALVGDDVTALPTPHQAPPVAHTVAVIQAQLAERSQFARLTAAFTDEVPEDVADELRGILGEIFDVLGDNRMGIKLLDAVAPDFPDVFDAFYGDGRFALVETLAAYLSTSERTAALRTDLEPSIAARVVLETIAFWAIHRFWDPSPQAVDDQQARDVVIEMLVGGLVRSSPHLRRQQ